MHWKQEIYQHGPQPVLVITTAHLRQKPLSFFVTMNGKSTSAWNTAINQIKNICGFNIANGIVRIGYYYLASYLSFPIQVWPVGNDKYEVNIYQAGGDGMLFVKTYHKPCGQRLNKTELAEIATVIKCASDKLRCVIEESKRELADGRD